MFHSDLNRWELFPQYSAWELIFARAFVNAMALSVTGESESLDNDRYRSVRHSLYRHAEQAIHQGLPLFIPRHKMFFSHISPSIVKLLVLHQKPFILVIFFLPWKRSHSFPPGHSTAALDPVPWRSACGDLQLFSGCQGIVSRAGPLVSCLWTRHRS